MHGRSVGQSAGIVGAQIMSQRRCWPDRVIHHEGFVGHFDNNFARRAFENILKSSGWGHLSMDHVSRSRFLVQLTSTGHFSAVSFPERSFSDTPQRRPAQIEVKTCPIPRIFFPSHFWFNSSDLMGNYGCVCSEASLGLERLRKTL